METTKVELGKLERRKLSHFFSQLLGSKGGVVGVTILLIIVAVTILVPYISPYDPIKANTGQRLTPPVYLDGGTWEYVLGTDELGRCILSRILYGLRVSILVGGSSVIFACVIGVILGLLGGYYGGKIDFLVMSITNLFLSFPFVLLCLATIAAFGPSLQNLIIVLGITSWPIYTRVIRGEVLSLKNREHIVAVKALGASNLRIVVLHLIPSLVSSTIVISSLQVAQMIIMESFVSFLGLGIQPPTPSLGGMLNDSRDYLMMYWWLGAQPGIAIVISVLGINLFGDWLRDYFDPHIVIYKKKGVFTSIRFSSLLPRAAREVRRILVSGFLRKNELDRKGGR
jgi:peptide/nickel transport system permease protein